MISILFSHQKCQNGTRNSEQMEPMEPQKRDHGRPRRGLVALPYLARNICQALHAGVRLAVTSGSSLRGAKMMLTPFLHRKCTKLNMRPEPMEPMEPRKRDHGQPRRGPVALPHLASNTCQSLQAEVRPAATSGVIFRVTKMFSTPFLHQK